MEQFLAFPLEQIPYVAATLIIALTVHEFAHAYTAYKFGDETAKKQGRLTLNPIQHLDPVGTILIFIAGFGWARPVPVNRFFFKNPKLAGITVSVAGPLSNLVLTVIGFALLYGLASAGLANSLPEFIPEFLEMFIRLNLILFVFNLLPLPPLDGYRIIEDLAPRQLRAKMTQFETYGSLIFIILVITPLGDYTIQPVFNIFFPVIFNGLDQFFYQLFL
ncbi:site-2 protease family protein [Bacillus canaveralius]|uniref:Site-2 protease family protein n=1 Tax=Bacillus canaveralius TaxID=1403243 RepID=A0A2N5GJT8_9BACI|nr:MULTISPECIES: site-2 protease family protein [Bacillus]PLR81569.1 site-2 protease family protein [Bacillus canaveralius]PLR85515.1 site-2 protease family protein [Bacillus sp. V33-4]PLR90891.1 site-2 protease family protein [Bacillus canaveralius]RSK57539.1 site-2 protease family protein [Bacillus canaveralius]